MTIEEIRQLYDGIAARREKLHSFLGIEEKTARLAELEAKMNAVDFWNDKEAAQQIIAEQTRSLSASGSMNLPKLVIS